MPYYKAPDGSVHFLDDENFAYLLPVGSIQISDDAAVRLQQPSEREQIILKIVALENTITPRRLREATLGIDDGWLARIDAEIGALRQTL